MKLGDKIIIKKLWKKYSNFCDRFLNIYSSMCLMFIITLMSYYFWAIDSNYYLVFDSIIWFYLMYFSFSVLLALIIWFVGSRFYLKFVKG